MSCVACKKPVRENWKRCPECKAKIKRCQICKQILNDSWICCPYCDDLSEEMEGAVAADTDLALGSDALPEAYTIDEYASLEKLSSSLTLRSDALPDSNTSDGRNTEIDTDLALGSVALQEAYTIDEYACLEKLSSSLTLRSDALPDSNTSDGRNTEIVADVNQPLEKDSFTIPDMSQYLNGFEDAYKQHGIKMLYKLVKKDISNWKTIPLQILVVGESGAGKSSFINAMLGLRPTDDGAAKVGITETTKVKRKYPHPKYPNFVLVDAPGVGTQNFPKKNYLELIDLKTCEFIIIISSSRFKENDAWLASETRKAQKKFYFVRTKIDVDIHCESEASGLNEGEVVNVVREDCRQSLTDIGVEKPDVFIISSSIRWRAKFYFNLLIQQLQNDAPSLKKESMMLAISLQIQPVLKEKKLALKQRIGKVALSAVFNAILPIRDCSKILMDEVRLYQAQFGIDDDSLCNIARQQGMELIALKEIINLQSSDLLNSRDEFEHFCSHGTIVRSFPTTTLGSLIVLLSGQSRYNRYCCALYELLTMCYAESLKVLKLV